MNPLRAIGFRMVTMPSIEDIQWAKSYCGTLRGANVSAMRRRPNPFFASRLRGRFRYRGDLLARLSMRLGLLSEAPPKMKRGAA